MYTIVINCYLIRFDKIKDISETHKKNILEKVYKITYYGILFLTPAL